MKFNYKISLLAAGLFLCSGCYDLDRYPADKLSSGTFWKTQDHADQGLMGVYSVLQNNHVYGLYFGLDCLTDISYARSAVVYNDIAMGTTTAYSSVYSNRWKNLYEGVARANTAIQNIPNVDMSDELKARYIAEAKFLRAFYYSQLLDLFGGVPLYDETTVVESDFNNMLKPRSSADETRQFIMDDLEEAIANLPDQWDDANKGRATQGAANALMGKVLLYAKQYSEAAKYLEQVRARTDLYGLYSDYAGIFKPGGDESEEMVFAIQNLGGMGQDYGIPLAFYLGTRSTYGSDWNSSTVDANFVANYEYKDGRPFDWDEFAPGFNEDNAVKEEVFVSKLTSDNKQVEEYTPYKEKLLVMYDERDPRMQVSIILPYTMYKGWASNAPKDCEYVLVKSGSTLAVNGMIQADGNLNNYLWRKFVPEYDMDGMINNREDTPINFPIIRYADVLLMLAECYNEMDGRRDEAVALINEVRARVGMPGINSGPTWLAANSKEEVFERIKHERAVEFACEGLRFSDLRRWGIYEQTMNGKTKVNIYGDSFYSHSVTTRDNLWPIPGSERDKNPLLEQNPGWD